MSALRRFRYPLEAALKKTRWDEQSLRQELAIARDACARLRQERDRVAGDVLVLNEDLARLQSGLFDPAQHQRLAAWRQERQAVLETCGREVRDAQANQERIEQQLARAVGAVRGHENYRERLAGEHRLAGDREEARRVNDAWLLRRGWLEGQA